MKKGMIKESLPQKIYDLTKLYARLPQAPKKAAAEETAEKKIAEEKEEVIAE